jgi:DsbC/DsbD-like thiol-disulfide interchange protein
MSGTQTDLAQWLKLRARVEPGRLRPGARATLVVEAEVPAGCHIEVHEPSEPFLVPTELSPDPIEGVTTGPVRYPPAKHKRFDWSPAVLRVYEGSVRFEAPLEVKATAAAGLRTIHGRLRYQGCTPAACLMPAVQAVEAQLDIKGKSDAASL